MKNIVLNEREILEKALLNGEVSEDYNDTVDVLIRHYLHMGYDKNEVYDLVDKFLTDNMETYRRSNQITYLKSKIDFILKGGRFDLVNIKSIHITNSEWNIISSIEDDKVAKIMFILLIRVKLYMAKNKKNTPVMIINLKEILREVSINTKMENMFLFNELTKLGLITTRLVSGGGNSDRYHTMVRIHFIDINDKDYKKEIDNFKNVVTYFYELYKRWKYKECERCGARFKLQKSDYTSKHCSKCKKDIRNEKQKSIMREKRKNLKR